MLWLVPPSGSVLLGFGASLTQDTSTCVFSSEKTGYIQIHFKSLAFKATHTVPRAIILMGQAVIFFLRVNEAAQGVQGLRNKLGCHNPVPYALWLLLSFPTSNTSCTQV